MGEDAWKGVPQAASRTNSTSWFTSEDASANDERRMYLTRNRGLMIIEGELYYTDRNLAQHRASVSGGISKVTKHARERLDSPEGSKYQGLWRKQSGS